MGQAVGGEVGYRVRFDSRVGPETRVVFLTPGVALRMIQEKPEVLDQVACVLLDEFHERAAEVDAVAALVLQSRLRSGSTTLWILSATIEVEPLVRWMSPFGSVRLLESHGRSYPVEVSWHPPSGRDVVEAVAEAVAELHRRGPLGDVLCFLPGVGEIRRTRDLLERKGLSRAGMRLWALHGDMEPEEQDAALNPARPGEVNVLLSTNVAETSLTLPGVRHVVDGGYVRVAKFDPRRGLNTLYTVRASQRSADQRAGRAGRVAEGTCWRLWAEHDIPPADEPPEVCRIELSDLWLRLALSGDPALLPWATPPSGERIEAAKALLSSLGALAADGTVTEAGRRMAALPVSPRSARVLLEAERLGGFDRALRWVAGFESRDPSEADRLARRLADGFRPKSGDAPLGRLLLPAFADRLAVAISPGRWRLPDGRIAECSGGEDAAIVVALEVQEMAGGGKGPRLYLRESEPVDLEWIHDAWPDRIEDSVEVAWDPRIRRVVGSRVVRLSGQILLSSTVDDNRIPRARAEELLASLVASGEIRWKWGEEEEAWVGRSRRVAEAFPEKGMCRFEEGDLDLVRAALVEGCLAAAGVESRPVLPLLREVQGGSEVSFVERMAPESVSLSSGRKAKLVYGGDGTALISARIGDFVGVRQESVRIAQGRIPLVFEILAPNWRPVQRTSDLDGFWSGSYPAIKADLKRRYPRHPWP